ncbi:hypothetical protein AOLI_G00126120 [Acnodon oligacanthus]
MGPHKDTISIVPTSWIIDFDPTDTSRAYPLECHMTNTKKPVNGWQVKQAVVLQLAECSPIDWAVPLSLTASDSPHSGSKHVAYSFLSFSDKQASPTSASDLHLDFGSSPIAPELKEHILERIKQEVSHAFSKHDLDIGNVSRVVHRIELEPHIPFKERMRRVCPANFEDLRRHLLELLDCGIIEEANSPYASAIVLVRKKNGDLRMVVDYRKLNSLTKKDAYPLSRIEETFSHLAVSKWFTILDLKSGYYQLEKLVAKLSSEAAAFTSRHIATSCTEALHLPRVCAQLLLLRQAVVCTEKGKLSLAIFTGLQNEWARSIHTLRTENIADAVEVFSLDYFKKLLNVDMPKDHRKPKRIFFDEDADTETNCETEGKVTEQLYSALCGEWIALGCRQHYCLYRRSQNLQVKALQKENTRLHHMVVKEITSLLADMKKVLTNNNTTKDLTVCEDGSEGEAVPCKPSEMLL